MIKQALLAMILTTTISNVSAQFTLDEKYENGFTAGIFGNAYFSNHLYTGISAGYNLEKHSFSLAAGVTPYTQGYNLRYYTLIAGYNYFPNGMSNRHNLFFDVNLLHDVRLYKETFYNPYPYIAGQQTITRVTGLCTAGFGFMSNLSQHLYIKTAIGMGVSVDYKYKDAELGANFRLDLGFRF